MLSSWTVLVAAISSLAGEIMMRFAAKKGLAGIVVDGCLRDLMDIELLDMPIYAKGITPQGPWKFGPGEVNVPVACGGTGGVSAIFWRGIRMVSSSSAVRM